MDLEQIESGNNICWPRLDTDKDEIRGALLFVLQTIPSVNEIPIPANLSATQCFRRLIVKVHPDRYASAGFRVAYATAVCTALLNRCQSVLEQQNEMMNALDMPRMLITPFATNRARYIFPPSSFEYVAVDYAHNHNQSSNAPRRSKRQWNETLEQRDEQRFCTAFHNSRESYAQVIYGIFDTSQWKFVRYIQELPGGIDGNVDVGDDEDNNDNDNGDDENDTFYKLMISR